MTKKRKKIECLYVSRYAPNRTRTDPYTGLPWYLSEVTDFIGLWGRGNRPVPFLKNCKRVFETNPRWWGLPKSLYSVFKFIRETDQIDTVICGVDEYSLIIGIFVGKIANASVFCVVEDPPFTDRYHKLNNIIRRQEKRLRHLFIKSMLKKCTGIFCFIEKDVLNEFDLDGVPVLQFMNGVSTDAIKWVQNHPIEEQDLSECIIGYVGAINKKQGIDDLLNIFAAAKQKVDNLRLRLIGPIDNDYVPCYQKKLCDLGLDSAVEITGWLPYEKMLEKLQECSICVHVNPPTQWFRAAQPLKICEYLALGKRTVAWDYPGTRRLLDHGRLGVLIPARNMAAFRDGLIEFSNPMVRNSVERELHGAICGEWTSDYWYGRVLDILREGTR